MTPRLNGHWDDVRLGDLCDRITVGHVGPMADRYTESGTPFLRSQDIEPFAIRTDSIKYIGDAFTKELRKSELREGDVVIVRTGYPGTAAVVPQGLSLANCADLVIISPGACLDAWFLACLFNSAWGRGTVRGSLVGVAQQHFNVGAAREMRALVPPLAVQQRIGEIVKAYTDLIELNQRRIAILEEMARRLFEEWFVRFRYPGGVRTTRRTNGHLGRLVISPKLPARRSAQGRRQRKFLLTIRYRNSTQPGRRQSSQAMQSRATKS